MTRWTCPHCDREFGRRGQSHLCVPGCTVEETFAAHPDQLPAYEAVTAFLDSLGPYHADAVGVGVFLKTSRTVAEVRPKSRWLSLEIALRRRVDHPRVSRVLQASAGRTVNVVRLRGPEDVDDQVREWLAEAYDTADL